MTRARLTLALVLAVILVGTATWVRFSRASVVEFQNLVAIEAPRADPNEVATAILSTSSTTKEDLTDTDLIGRQLFSDFVGLAANGQVTDENVKGLATAYANSLNTLDKSKRFAIADLHLVADSSENIKAYMQALDEVYAKYQSLMAAEVAGVKDFSNLGPGFVKFASNMEDLYRRASLELENISVPASLLEAHGKLINNYLSSETAMTSLTEVEKDPASAFAAILSQEQNTEDEKTILAEIRNIVDKGGIISSNP